MDAQALMEVLGWAAAGGTGLGAAVGGSVFAYKRLMGRQPHQEGEHYADLSAKLDRLEGRVDRIEAGIQHLPNSETIIRLIESVHGVDKKVARIEGFMLGTKSLADE
jgi:hypothetical protein